MATSNIRFTEKQAQAAELLTEALEGDRAAQNRLVEGISTSDLPVQLAPALSQIAFNNYADQPKIWNQWASRELFDDFRETEFMNFAWDHTDPDIEPSNVGYKHAKGGLPVIPEYGEYPVIRFEASGQGLKIHKNGVQIKFSWESIVNDRQFRVLQRVPAEFGRRAAVQEDVEATRPLLSSVNFSAANGNVFTGNPKLTYDSLKAAREFISQQEYNGRRVVPAARYRLVVPSALVPTAEGIKQLQSREIVTTSGDVTTRDVYGNEVAGWFDIVENPYLTSEFGAADTNWWLIPVPGTTPNPNVINGFLRGHETPRIFVKSNTNSAPEDGDFVDDSYSTKTRHVVTGGFVRPEGTLFSAGTGS